MKVSIDKNTCIGCGACAAIEANVFEMDDESKASVKKGKETVPADKVASVKEAADSCPVSAIKVN
jgi:ferredoxin